MVIIRSKIAEKGTNLMNKFQSDPTISYNYYCTGNAKLRQKMLHTKDVTDSQDAWMRGNEFRSHARAETQFGIFQRSSSCEGLLSRNS